MDNFPKPAQDQVGYRLENLSHERFNMHQIHISSVLICHYFSFSSMILPMLSVLTLYILLIVTFFSSLKERV